MKRHALTLTALLTAALTAGLVTPLPAAAGEYMVHACDPAFGDVNHSWYSEWNDSRMAAYATCPVPSSESRLWNQGLVTRQSVTTGPAQTVSYLAYSGLRLRAPPGASVWQIRFTPWFCGDDHFTTGMLDATWHWVFPTQGAMKCDTSQHYAHVRSLFGTPSVVIATICAEPSGCSIGSSLGAWATMRSATVWIRDSTLPTVAITGGSITARQWLRGMQSIVITATDNVGVQHVDVYLDGQASVRQSGACDWTYVVPCSISLGSLPVDSRIVSDGTHTITVTARDSAGNVNSTSQRVLIDNTAPPGPLNIAVSGGTMWQATNDFDIAWANPPQPGTANIARVNWAVCPVANAIGDLDGCTRGWKAGGNIQALSGVQVPGAGDWVAQFWLTDAAGNSDPATARPVHLRLDPDPPAVAILDQDASDPQRVTVVASDALSGLAHVELEMRRENSVTWTSLPVTTAGGAFVARVDDAALPNGRYLLRARAVDVAGNERTTDLRSSGSPAVLNLPLRVPTSVAVGTPRRVRGRHGHVRTVLHRRLTTSFGRSVPVRGRLTLPGGNPVAGTDLEVFQQTALTGAVWRRIGIVHTDKHGRFSYRARPGPSRLLRFEYAGTPLIRPATAWLRIRVRAATSFYVSRHHVVNGDEVLFHGRIRGKLRGIRKLVQLQAYSRGAWRTFATPRAARRSHRWRYAYRFSATRGTVRYRFRVVLPTEAGVPYVRGVSRRIRVTVRGL